MSFPSAGTDLLIRAGIVVLTLCTALIHLSLNFPDPMFILNCFGYLALLAALYLPVPQLAGRGLPIRRIFVGYTALTILLWVALGARTPIGYTDKLVEISLIVLLLLEGRRTP